MMPAGMFPGPCCSALLTCKLQSSTVAIVDIRAAGKFFLFLLFMMLTLLYFTYYGVACVAVTPNLMMAAILSGAFYGLMNLFAGFVMPKPNYPGLWVWVSAYPLHCTAVLICRAKYCHTVLCYQKGLLTCQSICLVAALCFALCMMVLPWPSNLLGIK